MSRQKHEERRAEVQRKQDALLAQSMQLQKEIEDAEKLEKEAIERLRHSQVVRDEFAEIHDLAFFNSTFFDLTAVLKTFLCE